MEPFRQFREALFTLEQFHRMCTRESNWGAVSCN
jgi:hypothetical protein